MRAITLILSLCIVHIFSAQEYVFTYETKFKTDSLAKEHKTAYYTLDIGKKEVKFYPTEALANDSIYKATKEFQFLSKKLNGFQHLLKRKRDGNEYLNYHIKSPLYYVVKTTDTPQKWTIENDTKTIGDYKVRKAVTDFGGRSWVAWYAEEIALPEGPYKFRGLPGLILEIYDTQANFLFQIKEVKKKTKPIDTENFLENLYDKKPIALTEKQWEQLNLDYYHNPGKDFEGSTVYVKDKDGKVVPVKLNSKATIEATQKHLRKENNPIELDKAIRYPN